MFPYHANSLQWTNEQYHSLEGVDREHVDAVLAGTGVESMLSLGD